MTRRRNTALMPGDVRTAFVECTFGPGKRRPTVLVRREEVNGEPWWRVVSLTSRSHFSDGTPRVPVSFAVGLGTRGYLWGGSSGLALVPEHVIEGARIGVADRGLVQAITDRYPHEVSIDDAVAMLIRDGIAS